MTEIVELRLYPSLHRCSTKLLEQLTNRPVKLTEDNPQEIISQENTHLFSYWLIRKLREC